MHKTLAASLLAAAFGLLASPIATAQATDARKQAVAEKWKEMTPEEQAAAKAKAKAKWDSMTPEEQAAAKQKFAEKHPQAAKRMQSKASAPATPAPAPSPASAPAK